MPSVRPMGNVAKKWADRAGTAGPQYAEGVQMPKADWQAQTIGAAANWEAGITEAARNKSFASGVNRAGTKKWQSKAISKGVARYGAGVADAQPDYQAGFEPYRQIIESTTLPPRFAKGDPRNVERVKVMAGALRKGKTSGR